jgi:RHS repeat-associated protein
LVVRVSDGSIIQRLEHDEFGRTLVNTNAGFIPFGFAGGLEDFNTGLLRFGARDYDSIVGRWTAKDPILFSGGDNNLYGYVLQDPVNWIDPTGAMSENTVKQAARRGFWAGMITGSVVAIVTKNPWASLASGVIGFGVGAGTIIVPEYLDEQFSSSSNLSSSMHPLERTPASKNVCPLK